MDISNILDTLNEAQRQAVAAPPGALLVLAGAGSGKTRVLTHRIAWLVQVHQVSPLAILAVTFTNKASKEMRGRIEELLQIPFHGMWMGTFHSLCHRLLRMHFEEAGLAQSFEILDSDDQYRLVRRVLRELELDEAYWPPRQMQWMINSHKDAARRPQDLPQGNERQQQILHQVYSHYEALCRRFDVLDFAEILLRTLELFQHNQTLRETYQQRFHHILVDEFQDTNAIQYQWVKMLSEGHKNLFAVGDDDQSIYGWRGAQVENILNFEKDFEQSTVFRLEQNYRSSGNILKAANAVVANNSGRLGKDLWTDEADGLPIQLYAASNEIDEARFVVEQIKNWVARGNRRAQSAILYRSNAQSRAFEEQLVSSGMPYRVYGGLRFFDRAEIKDALAYLRLVSNRHSDPAFERVVNVPTRGIGNQTVQAIRDEARVKQISMWQASVEIRSQQTLSPRTLSAVSLFQDLIDRLASDTAELELAETTDHVLTQSGLMEYHQKERGERAQSRVENLQELVNATRHFTADDEDNDMDELTLFLAHAALEAGEEQAEEWEDCVQLMSLHSAKGLEFPLVFLCGMEEGLFPHQRAVEEDGRLEEERRLCYVGMTRAMQQLFLCYAEVRRLYGRQIYTRTSRFLSEIPEQYLKEIRAVGFSKPFHRNPTTHSSRTNKASSVSTAFDGLKPGRQVRHKRFGDGMVVDLEGQGSHARVQVNFKRVGMKWLVCCYANLEAV